MACPNCAARHCWVSCRTEREAARTRHARSATDFSAGHDRVPGLMAQAARIVSRILPGRRIARPHPALQNAGVERWPSSCARRRYGSSVPFDRSSRFAVSLMIREGRTLRRGGRRLALINRRKRKLLDGIAGRIAYISSTQSPPSWMSTPRARSSRTRISRSSPVPMLLDSLREKKEVPGCQE